MNKKQQKKAEIKFEKVANEIHKIYKKDDNENGYFTKLWEKCDKSPAENLKSFKFKKEVLNAYSPEFKTQRFTMEKNITSYLRDKQGVCGLKFSEDDDFVWAHLVDLTELPKNDQDWWHDHLVEEKD